MGFILTVDAGTTSIRAIAFDHDGHTLASSQRQLTQHYPSPGLVEHDPSEIWEVCIHVVKECLSEVDDDCMAIAITNQRETAIVWDRVSGLPLYNAIVWQDRRTEGFCDGLKASGLDREVFSRTGLQIDPYFSGTKVRWLIDNVPEVRDAVDGRRAMFGTVDSWIIWNLTGRRCHVTDHSNASRTMLFNIHTLDWDDVLLESIGVPRPMLPELVPTSSYIGTTDPGIVGAEIPIASSVGDQQSALFGQCCFQNGDVKVTFGTGGFLLMNVGAEPTRSINRLLTTVAWTGGERAVYALEGSVYIAGAAVQWLRDELGIVEESAETETMAMSVSDAAGCVVVPAFTGLGAPHWEPGARGMITGLTRGVNRNHLARAVLESIAFQARDVIEAMSADAQMRVSTIKVDGGASANSFLCQFLADISGVRVLRPKNIESTALGAAYMAGLTVGFWSEGDVIDSWELDREFIPSMSEEERDSRLADWNRAVECAKLWSGRE